MPKLDRANPFIFSEPVAPAALLDRDPEAALTAALRGLIDTGEVVPDPTRATGHRVVDPLLAHWVRAGRPGG